MNSLKARLFHLPLARIVYQRLAGRSVNADQLLIGDENGAGAGGYARLLQQPMWASTPLAQSPHVKLLEAFQKEGEAVLEPLRFRQTAYFENAARSVRSFGYYFEARSEDELLNVAREFVRGLAALPAGFESRVLPVRPVRFSQRFQLAEDPRLAASAFVRGQRTFQVLPARTEVQTPLQTLLLDVLWMGGKRELYQPVNAPEVCDGWPLTRRCTDRLEMMQRFLKEIGLAPPHVRPTYLDIGSFYGWFVDAMSRDGYDGHGVELDPIAAEVGTIVYALPSDRVTITDAVPFLESQAQGFDVVSCLSVLHHFVCGRQRPSAPEFIRSVDAATRKVLFLDTGQAHESWFNGALHEWTPDYIEKWLREHTTFREFHRLGTDQDARFPHKRNYGRTLFACVR